MAQQSSKIDSLIEFIRIEKPDTVKVTLMDDLCWEYMYTDPEQSISYAKEALVLARKLNFPRGEGKLLNTLGVIHANFANYQNAMKYYNEAIHVREAIHDEHGVAVCLINIGNIYVYQGNYDSTIAYYM